MIRFKDLKLGAQWAQLKEENPVQYALVAAAVAYAWHTHGQEAVITSLHRPEDTRSVHAYWRGTDLRIHHPDRPVREEDKGWAIHVARDVVQWLNGTFEYGRTGKGVALIHGTGLDEHVHIQSPFTSYWQGGPLV